MVRMRWAAALTAAVLLPASQVQLGQAASTPAPKGVIIAASNVKGNPITRAPGARAWRGLGGVFAGRPAVAYSNGKTHYFGTTPRGVLLHRTSTTGWHSLSKTPCWSPHAAAYNGTVRVACIGPNRTARTMVFRGTTTKPYQVTLSNLGGYVNTISVMVDAAGYSFFATGKRYRSRSGNRTWTSNTYVKYPGSTWRHWDTYCSGPITVASSTRRVFLGCQVGRQLLVEVFDWTLPRSSPNFYKYWFLRTSTTGTIGIAATGNGSTGVVTVQGGGVVRYVTITKNGSSSRWVTLSGRSRSGVAAAPTGRFAPLPVPTTPAPPTATPTPSESTPARPPTEPPPPPPTPVTTTVTTTVTRTAPPPSTTTAPPPSTTTTAAPTTTAPPTTAPPTTAPPSSTSAPPSPTSTGAPTTTTAPPSEPPVTTSAPPATSAPADPTSSAPGPSTSVPESSAPPNTATGTGTTTVVPSPTTSGPGSITGLGLEDGPILAWTTVALPSRSGVDGFLAGRAQP